MIENVNHVLVDELVCIGRHNIGHVAPEIKIFV